MSPSRARLTISVAACLDVVGALVYSAAEHVSVWVGLYWSIATATTVGYGDVTPHTTIGHVVAVTVMLTVIPLFAATFSLLTSGLTAMHVSRESERLGDRLDHIIKNHPDIPEFKEKP